LKAVINIVKSGFSGKEVPEREKVELEKGDMIDMLSGFGNPTAKVKDIRDNYIVLLTSRLAPREKGKGVNLKEDFSGLETEIKKGESRSFSTQTLDAGSSFVFTLVDIINS
jgi:hypothetical protein